MADIPLVVDMDGTLIHTDLLHESALRLARDRPLAALQIPCKLRSGKAALKQHVATHTEVKAESLPYNEELLQWLREEQGRGRQLILCTASNGKFAQSVADHLGLFDDVMASDHTTNLGGAEKARALCARFGRGEFDYAGNSSADLAIWECAAQAVLVNASDAVAREVSARFTVDKVFPPIRAQRADWLRALRLQQWLKNLLLFAPMLAAHRVMEPGAFLMLLVAFFSFSLSASATYLMNDLLDLESDRLHPRKRYRPLAAGLISAPRAIAVGACLLALGLLLAAAINVQFLLCLVCYLLLTCCYSWFLKRLILLDCLTLAMLYTLRIIAGAAALDMGLSFWLLSFSIFLFLSLAFVKRYAEIEVQMKEGRDKVHGRGYLTSDAPLLQTLGITAGYAAVLLLSLYLNSEEIRVLYAHPQVVWAAVLVLLYWVSWVWMQAHRGLMYDDPLVFAIKDKMSLLSGVAFLLVIFLGTIELP
jgi:4-hydroxybenzoate polyprenyltransferase/phosphoserine phosphatase